MKNPEKKTFIRFMFIYLSISLLLFVMTSMYYYYDQTKQIEGMMMKEMSSYGTYFRENGEEKPSQDYAIKVLPKATLPYPDFIDLNGTYVSTSCGGLAYPKHIVAVYAKPKAVSMRKQIIKKKIAIFMGIAFVLNLIIAFILSFISLQPIRIKNRELQEFVDDVIHDLNAPVSAISINLESLQEECTDKKILRIARSVDSIRNLYANLEVMLKNEYKSTSKEIDINEYVLLLIEQLQAVYPHVRFRINLAPTVVQINTFAFERILINLIQNASKYTQEHPVVEFGIDDKNCFYIKDNGIGIENPQDLFQRTKQKNHKNVGYGLGLNIVKKLSAECNIPFEVVSKKDEGTIFYFDISKHIIHKT